ncbi:hypothetical protein V6N13_103627 [Hibiscus sabdariffa]
MTKRRAELYRQVVGGPNEIKCELLDMYAIAWCKWPLQGPSLVVQLHENGGNVRWIWLYGIRLSMGWWGWYVGWRYLVWVLSMSCITRSGWHIAVRVVALRLVSPEEMVKGDAPMIEGVLELDSTSHQAKEFDFRNSNSNCNLDLRPDNIINEVDNVANAIVPMTNFVVQSEELLTVEVVLSKGLSHKV